MALPAPSPYAGHVDSGPRRITVIPYGTGIGDLALQRGLIAAVARRWPRAAVSVYAPAASRWLIPDGVETVPRILGIPAWQQIAGSNRWFALLGPLEWRAIDTGFRIAPVRALARIPRRCLEPHVDLVIDFLGAFVAHVDFEREWLADGNEATVHVVERLASYLLALGVATNKGDRSLAVAPSAADSDWAGRVHRPLAAGRRTILINPHAGNSLKLPPERFWHMLVSGIRAAGLQPVICSGATAAEAAASARIAATGAALVGRATLTQLIALGRCCAAAISPDTGLLHLLALDGQRWVGLFGSTNPYLLGPYDRSRGRLLLALPPAGRACRSCWQRFTVGSTCCPVFSAGSCLSQLDPQAALTALADVLSQEATPDATCVATDY